MPGRGTMVATMGDIKWHRLDESEWQRAAAAFMAWAMLAVGVGDVVQGDAPDVEFVSVPMSMSSTAVTGAPVTTTSGAYNGGAVSWDGGPIDHATGMTNSEFLALQAGRLKRPGYMTRPPLAAVARASASLVVYRAG